MYTQKFKGKAVDMLTVCQTITEQALADKDFLIGKRPVWADPFFDNHLSRITAAFSGILGVRNVAEQRKATQLLQSLHHSALHYVGDFKIQFRQDFRKDPTRRDEILKTLGFDLLSKARKSQETVVQLLYQFKANLTDSLRKEITTQGTADPVIDGIIACADQLSQANITQEVLKGTTKVLNKKALETLNDIYSDTIAFAAIARNFYRGNSARQDIFSYAKTLKKLNVTAVKSKDAAVSS